MSEQSNVATPSPAYERMRPRWDLIDALLGGTESLREAGERYLPRYEAESIPSHRRRLQAATLFAYFRRALDDLASRPFQKDVKPADDAPAWVAPFAEDVDRQGNNLTVFAHRVFRDALANGLSFILVDAPQLPEGATLADERAAGGPYWVHVPARNVLALRTTWTGSREVVSHARILEYAPVIEPDGLSERTVRRVRVLEPGSFTLWEEIEGGDWEQIDAGAFGLNFVPLAPVILGEREAPGAARPPLLDLAHLNIAHWQSSSDQRHCLSVSRFPMIAASGVSPEELGKFIVGPNAMLSAPDASSRFYYVEPTGAAIEAGRKDLEDIEKQMAAVSVDLLIRRTGANGTATAAALEAARGASLLQTMALVLKDALELALQYAARYRGQPDGGSLEMDTDEIGAFSSVSDLDYLLKAYTADAISRETLIHEFQRRGVLSDALDLADDQERIENASPRLSGRIPDDLFEAA
jgi:hypothetical protein